MNLTLKVHEDDCNIYVQSTTDCDLLMFDKKEFADVLFKEMRDSLYEKILALKRSELFENISPYALVVICSNVEVKEYSHGDVIIRQDNEPGSCFIIVEGECKVVYEKVVYRTKEEMNAFNQKKEQPFKFGKNLYHPDFDYGGLDSREGHH